MRRIDRRSTRQAVAAGYVQPGSARVPISVVLTWLVIATLLAGCVGANPSDVSAGGGSAMAVAANLPADIGIMVYQGSDELGGEEVNLSEVLARGKPVVLNMWAGLCPVCRLEMAHLEEAYAAYDDQVVILGLDIGPFIGLGDRDDALALLAELDVSYPAGTTDDAAIVESYQVLGTPSLFFIAADGEIVRRWAGVRAQDKLTESIEELIAVSAGLAEQRE